MLAHPVVLDESLKDKVDMTMTKKEFLQAFKLVSPAKRAVSYQQQQQQPQQRRHPGAPVGYRRGSGPGPGPSRVVASPPASVVLNKRAELTKVR